MSDSKLSKLEKLELKNWKIQYPTVELHSFPEYSCVVGIRATGKYMAEFAIAICSDTESKFRRKTGEYAVLYRVAHGSMLPTPRPQSGNLGVQAAIIAVAVKRGLINPAG